MERDPSKSTETRLSREEVITAFRIVLCRSPESEQTIEDHRVDTLEALGVVLIRSPEFAKRYKELTTERAPSQPAVTSGGAQVSKGGIASAPIEPMRPGRAQFRSFR
jgi:hypothetical protein